MMYRSEDIEHLCCFNAQILFSKTNKHKNTQSSPPKREKGREMVLVAQDQILRMNFINSKIDESPLDSNM